MSKRNKIKKREYNKFFSYKNTERKHRNFMYKNFHKSKSYNTRFTGSDFSFANFSKSTMKYCGFNGCTFNGTEFKNSNLRGCRFKGAQFNSVYFINTSIKKCYGISKETPGIIFINNHPSNHKISSNLYNTILDCNKNNHIYNSETLIFHKKKRLNYVNITRLLTKFSEEQIIKGLQIAADSIKNDFFTLSYLIKIIDKISE